MTAPTIGAKALYYAIPNVNDRSKYKVHEDFEQRPVMLDEMQPCAATVCFVHSPDNVNLAFIDHVGRARVAFCVKVIHDSRDPRTLNTCLQSWERPQPHCKIVPQEEIKVACCQCADMQ